MTSELPCQLVSVGSNSCRGKDWNSVKQEPLIRPVDNTYSYSSYSTKKIHNEKVNLHYLLILPSLQHFHESSIVIAVHQEDERIFCLHVLVHPMSL